MADFTSRFRELLARSPGTDAHLAEAIGVSKQSVSAWKNGTRFPKWPAVKSIAEYFNVNAAWLEGVTDDDTPVQSIPQAQTSPAETELLSIYRDLNDSGQNILLNTARGLAANPDMKKGGASTTETA